MRIYFCWNLIFCLTATLHADESQLKQKPIFIGGLDNVVEYRIPGVITTNTGTLITVCDARVDRPGDAINNIDLAVKRSTDSGRTWEPVRFVVDFPGKEAAADPCIVFDNQTQRTWLFYDYILAELAESGTRILENRIIALHTIFSDDEGKTWSDPRDLTSSVMAPSWEAVLVGPGSGSQTRDGRLLVPCYSNRTDDGYAHVLVSADHGISWQITSAASPNTTESAIVELTDGRWLLNMRNSLRSGYRVISTTADGGQHWEKAQEEMALPEPCCQGSLVRFTDIRDGHKKNRLLFSNPSDREQRRNMTVHMSYDEGKTWPVSKVIYTGPSAYSCLTILKDGTIGLLYENGENSPYERITFARFDLQWLSNGADRLEKPSTK